MSPKKQSGDISTKQIISGGILSGMIAWPFLTFVQDLFENKMLWIIADPHFFEHYWLYVAISVIGAVLAWSMPNSMAAWSNEVSKSAQLIPLVLIFSGTYRFLSDLVQQNLDGAIINLLLTTALLCLYALGVASYRRLKAKPAR